MSVVGYLIGLMLVSSLGRGPDNPLVRLPVNLEV